MVQASFRVQGMRMVRTLPGRFRRKVLALAPIVVGAVVLLAALAVLTYWLNPFLPVTYRQLLDHVQQGDWAGSRANVVDLFGAYGDKGPYVFVVVQILQVLLAPIPGQVMGLLGGALFGFWGGLPLTMLGLTLGSAIAMGSSRVFGDTVVRKLVPPAVLGRLDNLMSADGVWGFFVIFLLPTLPDDAVCFMAGLTRLPLHRLLLVCVLGRLPGMAALTYIGAGVGGGPAYANLFLGVTTLIAVVLWLFDEEVTALFTKPGST